MSSTPPGAAQVITLPVRADDILVLASDGLSDNLWDEDVLDEVVRFRHTFLAPTMASSSQLPRRTLAGMLSEAICSRARRVSQRRSTTMSAVETTQLFSDADDEIPFGRRAREEGRPFNGGKPDGEYSIGFWSNITPLTPSPRRHFGLGRSDFACQKITSA